LKLALEVITWQVYRNPCEAGDFKIIPVGMVFFKGAIFFHHIIYQGALHKFFNFENTENLGK